MARLGTLTEWSLFLDAHSDDAAQAELSRYAERLEHIYAEITSLVGPLWDSPTGELAEVLMVGRTAMADAIHLLEGVRARYGNGPEAA